MGLEFIWSRCVVRFCVLGVFGFGGGGGTLGELVLWFFKVVFICFIRLGCGYVFIVMRCLVNVYVFIVYFALCWGRGIGMSWIFSFF